MIKRILIILMVSVTIFSCNSGADRNKKTKETVFVAQIDSTMTLAQVAKVNNIGEPYLRTKLGIRRKIGNSYTVAEMAKRFKFSLDDLRKVIEDRKNKQAESIKKREQKAKEAQKTKK